MISQLEPARAIDARPALTPARAPLAMPRQSLHAKRTRPRDGAASDTERLALVLGTAALLSVIAVALTYGTLQERGLNFLETLMLALIFLNTFWIASSAITALIGAIVLIGRRPERDDARNVRFHTLRRTALVYPVYHEDFAQVLARAHEGFESLGEDRGAFEVFFLSDTSDPQKAANELECMTAYRAAHPTHPVFYRRRAHNVERKAGNIADFIRNWGARYDYMVVYDADSIMSADALRTLVQRMDARPSTALIQTVPTIVGARSLYAHMQQFALSAYGPLFGYGLAWWTGGAGNFWGHNAIIRVSAFAAHAGLPRLEGRAPFGGHILSHDFVEAALLRRAGWRVEIAPDIAGSHEQAPPTLIDAAARDRRWAQGNLQHGAIIAARGLDPISRAHLAAGIMGYASALLWVCLFVTGLLAAWTDPEGLVEHRAAFFTGAFTLGLLLAPKWLALVVWACGRLPGWRREWRFVVSLVLETTTSAMLAPILIVNQTAAIFSTLLGQDAGWRSQERERTYLRFGLLVRMFAPYKALAVAIVVVAWIASPAIGFAATPAALCLMSAAFISHALSQHLPEGSWFSARAIK